jgi:N-acetyl sugar amidotransferase
VTRLSRPQSSSFDTQVICNACRNKRYKQDINWDQRANQFLKLVKHNRASGRCKSFDVLIPVSGGKDSHWQIDKANALGLDVLAVTYLPSLETEIGRLNRANLASQDIYHINISNATSMHKTLVREGFKKFGSPAIPLHMQIFHTSRRLAARYEIPMVLWGENCALEYGATNDALGKMPYSHEWFLSFGNTFGTNSVYWEDELGLAKGDLEMFADCDEKMVEPFSDFFGNYFYWNPHIAHSKAVDMGFISDKAPLLGYYSFADLDDRLMILHHFMKYVKFGVSRTEDNLSIDIREGIISRDEAIRLLDSIPIPMIEPTDLEDFSSYMKLSLKEFTATVLSFLPKI